MTKKKSVKLLVECKNCGEKILRYPSQVLKNVYCSKKCAKEYMETNHNVKTNCVICGKEILRRKSHYDKTKNNYCSYECSNEGFSKFYSGKDNPNFLNTYTNCSYCGKEIYRKQSELKRRQNFFCSLDCQSQWQSENIVGKSHPNYDDTLSEEDRLLRRSIKGYWQFREAVYKRDNYTCQICGYNKGGILNAHHLNSFHWDKANRVNIENAVTMCENCHKEYHSIYGNRNNTKEQFIKYIKDKAL